MTIKQKNRIFLGGFTVLVLISYQFSFKKTLALRTSINQLKEDKIQLENAGDNLQTLQQQNVFLNNILRSNYGQICSFLSPKLRRTKQIIRYSLKT